MFWHLRQKPVDHGDLLKRIWLLDLIFPHSKLFQVSNKSQPPEVTTESSEWKVLGFANRSALPPKILNFCGTLPTYEIKIEAIPLDDQDSGKKTSDLT